MNRWVLGAGIVLAAALLVMNSVGFSMYHWAMPGRSAMHGTPGAPGHGIIWHK